MKELNPGLKCERHIANFRFAEAGISTEIFTAISPKLAAIPRGEIVCILIRGMLGFTRTYQSYLRLEHDFPQLVFMFIF